MQLEVPVPDELLQKLVHLRCEYALLLMRIKRAIQNSSQAEENFISFLQELVEGDVPSDCNFHSAFEILKKEEISLFNITVLQKVSTCTMLPDDVR